MEGKPDVSGAKGAGAGQGIVVVLAGFLPILAIVALAPAVPRMVEHFADYPAAQTLVPLAVTAPGLMIALFSPLMGWLTDRFGRRELLLWATFIYGLVGVLPFFLESLVAVFASRLALGICEAAILTVTNTLIGDYFAPDKRRTWLMIQAAAGPFFGVTVLTLSGYLASTSWQTPFLIYGCALPIFAAMWFTIFEPDLANSDEEIDAAGQFPWNHVLLAGGVTLVSASLYYVYIVQIGLAFAGIGVNDPGKVGMLVGVANLGVFIGGIVFKPLSSRLGSATQIAVFLLLLGLGMIGIGTADSASAMTIFACIQQLGAGILIPSLVLWAMNGLPPQHRGRGMGVWSACFFLGQFASPLFVTLARTITPDIGGAFLVLGIIAIIGALASAGLSRMAGRNAQSIQQREV
ncbi:MFS transporter [Novosphingobium sp. SL115]|uniref:MFS transporter n=1 Tax=Novosphingobium sp. SL115 TaxID=2995150 RepID=UPI002274A4DD|nr:MFS transporter [Novosphingobium sp. SL115]MCY1671369.1 MFS transporter [Novosphingobium sp. SL115]